MHDDLILPPGFELRRSWLVPDEANALIAEIEPNTPWEQLEAVIYGRRCSIPRLTCWFGTGEYHYSGTVNTPHPWTPTLDDLRQRLEAATGARYNSCLANLYRSGNDAVGWHSDSEDGIGPTPTIASLSLGATRDFRIQRRADGETWTVPLHSGDLIVMSGPSQGDYMHSVPRRANAGTRVNLTYRWFGKR